MDTDQMTSRDNWPADLYARHSLHHRDFDDDFVASLPLQPDDRVIDLGCGTGAFAAALAQRLPTGEVLGIDASAAQIAHAQRCYQGTNLRFAVAPAQEFAKAVEGEGRWDTVVSRAVLHWIALEEHATVLDQVAGVLRPGGVLRAEFGGVGQLQDVRAILDEESALVGGPQSPWAFPAPQTWEELLAKAGFTTRDGWVRLLRQRRRFADAEAFVGWLRSQILIAYTPTMDPETAERFSQRCIARALQELRAEDGSFDRVYVRLDVLAHLEHDERADHRHRP